MDFLVKRDDLHRCRISDGAPGDPEPGQALLEVDAFALTANNVTYAVFGDAMSYWQFFPAEDGWGRIPVWGFAEVRASAHEDVPEGTRVFGYLPPSTHLMIAPDRVDDRGFRDGSAHRAGLPGIYNLYQRTDSDPAYAREREDQQMLFRPLFATSFLIDDLLAESDFFGARSVIISSASSKTASAVAFLLARRDGIEVIGLTSPGNADFVEGLGVYGTVATYDEVSSLPRAAAVYVDVAGNTAAREAVHRHYGDDLAHSAMVGAAHWDEMRAPAGELPGPDPVFFFAPERGAKRAADWGQAGFEARLAEAWGPYVDWTDGWLEVIRDGGPEAIERVYLEVLEGRSAPSAGHIVSPAP